MVFICSCILCLGMVRQGLILWIFIVEAGLGMENFTYREALVVYVNVSELVITFIVRYAGQGKGDGNDAVGESQDDDVKQCQLSSECIVVGRNLHVGLRRDMARPLPR